MTTREWWKKYYRAVRVCRREAMKATQDMMVYGTGVVKVSEAGAEHVPLPLIIGIDLASEPDETVITNYDQHWLDVFSTPDLKPTNWMKKRFDQITDRHFEKVKLS